MQNKLKVVFQTLITIVLLNGCAFTVHQTPVNYQFSGNIHSLNKNLKKTVSVGEFIDSRDITTKNMISNMRNLHDEITTGGWEAEKPIAEIVANAFKQGLKERGQLALDTGDYTLTGELLKFNFDWKTSASLSYSLSGKLNVKVQLENSKTKRIIYRDVFIGSATDNSDNTNDMVKNLFTKSLDNLVEKVLNDDYFIQQFE